MIKPLFTILFLFSSLCVFAQIDEEEETPTKSEIKMRCDNKIIIDSTIAIVKRFKAQGYEVYHGDFFELTNNEYFPIRVRLHERTAYIFIVVGQPDLLNMRVGIGHEVFGKDEIFDYIRMSRDHEHLTYFTYSPSFTGEYLVTVKEKMPRDRKKFCTSVFVLFRRDSVLMD